MKLIKDSRPLSYDFLPPSLPHREMQLKEMETLFSRVERQWLGQNILLKGRVGTGKTASARIFCGRFSESAGAAGRKVICAYVNCRSRTTTHSVIYSIAGIFNPKLPDIGYSDEYLLKTVEQGLEKERAHLIVILDEVDYIIRRSGSDIIYRLGRFSEFTGKAQNISMIAISQQDATLLMDDASRSTFKRSNTVDFPPYSADELADIISQRAGLSLYTGAISDESVGLLAKICSEEGDARYAIELLERAALMAETEGAGEIGPEHVRRAASSGKSLISAEDIEALTRQELMVLMAVLRTLKNRSEASTGEVEKEYRAVCEEFGESPRGHTQFLKYLDSLKISGLIDTEISSVRGRTRSIRTSAPTVELMRIIEKRLEP